MPTTGPKLIDSAANATRSATAWTPVLIFLCLILTATVSYRAISELIDDNVWVVHSYDVLEELLSLTSSLRDAESRQRGFIITGQYAYLENYQVSVERVGERLKRLKILTADNAAQQATVLQLEGLIRKRVETLAAVLEQLRIGGFEAARAALINNRGKDVMNTIAAVADEFYAEERRLLAQRSATSKVSEAFALKSFGIGWFFTAVMVGFSYFLLIRDLRQRKAVAEALREAHDELELRVAERTAELERSNRELQDFAYIASHDLQEPLRKIQIFSDRLRDKYRGLLDDTGRDYLERMRSAAQRMHRLIDDLLMFSRVSTKQQPFEPVDLNQIVADVVNDLEGSFVHYGGRVDVQPLPTIPADPLQMRQLFQNLVSNALKFRRPGVPPEVSITWQNRSELEDSKLESNGSGTCQIIVSDNGIGIEKQHVGKIFAPFQRLHGTSEYEGTGIGLAICRKIVERHHATIEVESVPGQGSAFIVAFPAKADVQPTSTRSHRSWI